MISDPVSFAASKIPNLTSCEKASCSNACAILTPLPPFNSTAVLIATSNISLLALKPQINTYIL